MLLIFKSNGYPKNFIDSCIKANLTEKRIKNAQELAISDHQLQYDSSITFDDFDILASDSNKFKLLIKESLLVKRDKPVLNRPKNHFR